MLQFVVSMLKKKGQSVQGWFNFQENLIELWRFFKKNPKRLKVYAKMALNSKEFKLTKKKTSHRKPKKLAENGGLVFKQVPRLLLKNMKVWSYV